MSEHALALSGGCLAAVLLVVLCLRTVLAERRAGTGDGGERSVRRPAVVAVLDGVGVLLLVVLVAALVGRIAVALGH
jgi:hypothetical protein